MRINIDNKSALRREFLWKGILGLGVLTAVVAVALFRWGGAHAGVRAALEVAQDTAPRFAHHRPPTKGSETYQYAYPARRLPAEAVYDPTPPPPPPRNRHVHEYELVITEDVVHEVAPGVHMPAWAFNGKVPGPVLRGREGDLMRIKLINRGKLPHTIHFHGIHPAEMDGVFELVPPGGEFTYEFVARPYGVFPYHCHSMPTNQHIHNGLYGMMIIDPREDRPPMRELAMVMSAFDLDRDGEADFYAWNGKAFQYADHPIELTVGEKVRMYVMNIFEEPMAPHIHGNMFHLIRSGTSLKPQELTDVLTLGIAERAILEFQYDSPGPYMFQCHLTEHMELGLMGWFQVKPKAERAARSASHAHTTTGAGN